MHILRWWIIRLPLPRTGSFREGFLARVKGDGMGLL